MRCPHCRDNIRIQGKFCPRCGEQIFGLPVARPPQPRQTPAAPTPPAPEPEPWSPPPLTHTPESPPPSWSPPPPPPTDLFESFPQEELPAAAEAGPILEIELEEPEIAPRKAEAGADEAVGKICPYCRFPLKVGEAIEKCPECAVPHHRDCWAENQGCTTYACRSGPQMAASRGGAPGRTGGPVSMPQYPSRGPVVLPGPALALLAQELDRMATNALVYSLLAPLFFLIPALIGLLAGLSVLGQIRNSQVQAPAATAKAWAAIVISAGWLLLGAVFFLMMLVAVQ